MTNGLTGDLRPSRRGRHGDRTRSASRRKKGTWKKLLWVKQSCKLRARLPLRIELINSRPRQLYGSRYLPRTSTAKSATPAVRFLATGGGFDCDSPACVLGHNIHRLFRRHLHTTRLPRSSSRMGIDWHISGMVIMGLVGGTGRVATAIATNLHTRGICFQLPIEPQSESSINVYVESPQHFESSPSFALRIGFFDPIRGFSTTNPYPALCTKLPLTRILTSSLTANIPPSFNSQIRPPNLLHTSRPLSHSEIPHYVHVRRFDLGYVLPPLHNQHLLLRLQHAS